MPSFQTFRRVRVSGLLVLGITFSLFVDYARADPLRVSTAECAPKAGDSQSYLVSEMRVPETATEAVSPPRLLYAVEPDFPAGISAEQFSGSSTVAMLLDTDGKPQQVHVARSIGAAFDENAVKAVKQYRFEPARLEGKPVAAKVCVVVFFGHD
jgi:TonB family protein